MADNVVVIGKGKLIADTSISKLVSGAGSAVFIRATSKTSLQKALDKAGFKYEPGDGGFVVEAARTDDVGKLAHDANLTVLELSSRSASLETAFLELTEGKAEYEAGAEKAGKK